MEVVNQKKTTVKQRDDVWVHDIYWCSWPDLGLHIAIGIRADVLHFGILISGIIDPLIWKPLGS